MSEIKHFGSSIVIRSRNCGPIFSGRTLSLVGKLGQGTLGDMVCLVCVSREGLSMYALQVGEIRLVSK